MGLPALLVGQSCPMGARNDPHPGQCGAYQDTNQDSICDLSQELTASPAPAASAEGAAFPDYNVWKIMLAVLALALATELFQWRVSGLAFRLQTAWNWVLLLSFFLCAVTGLFWVVPPASRPSTGLNLLFWHTEAGLVFIAAGSYHAVRRFACMLRGLKACFPAK